MSEGEKARPPGRTCLSLSDPSPDPLSRVRRTSLADLVVISELTLSSIEHAGPEHLVPDHIGVPRVFTDDESSVMFLNQPTGRRTSETSSITDSSVRCGEFNKDRSEDSDTP